MNSQYEKMAGSSLFEVLIATLIICSIMLGLINLQSTLSTNIDLANKKSHAEQMAFQLLDVYPDSIAVKLPNGWQYQVNKTKYNYHCDIVKVIIQPLFGNSISQERLFCQQDK
ncbi:prepilin-type N-terminal cleavage/methylation domain-containing protein [Orbus sturtevantii]|uniref:type IV pilus modification PilV family protein n=1 Tax=Orbus sturtevantii TaxID=3074109 RepID=UPI00370DA327